MVSISASNVSSVLSISISMKSVSVALATRTLSTSSVSTMKMEYISYFSLAMIRYINNKCIGKWMGIQKLVGSYTSNGEYYTMYNVGFKWGILHCVSMAGHVEFEPENKVLP